MSVIEPSPANNACPHGYMPHRLADPHAYYRRAAVSALTLIAATLRLWQCQESLWLDELHTAWTVDDGLAAIHDRARAGNYGPVYFILPWLSTRLFGMHEWSLRLPSLIAGIGLVPISYVVTRQSFRSTTLGFLAAAVTATDPHSLFYSLDARPYALVQLAALLHVWLFVRLLNHSRSSIEWLAYCVMGAGLFQLHYTSALLFSGEFAIMILWLLRRHRARVSGGRVPRQGGLSEDALLDDVLRYDTSQDDCLASHALPRGEARRAILWSAAMCLACLSAVGNLRHIAGRRELWNQFIDRKTDFLSLFPWTEYFGTCVVALAICWFAGRVFSRGQVQCDKNELPTVWRQVLWLLAWLLVPIAVAHVLTQLDIARLFYRRYAMHSYSALLILSAGLGTICSTRRTRITFALIFLASINLLLGPWQQYATDGRFVRHSHEDWRRAVSELNALRTEQTARNGFAAPVLVRTGLIEEQLVQSFAELDAMRDYLLFPVFSIYKLHAAQNVHVLTTSLNATDAARADIRSAGGCWLMIRGKKWFEVNSLAIVSRLQACVGGKAELILEKRRDFGNVVVLRCQTAAPQMAVRSP